MGAVEDVVFLGGVFLGVVGDFLGKVRDLKIVEIICDCKQRWCFLFFSSEF